MPHSTDLEYGQRAIPQYERAVVLAGAEPVRIRLDPTAAEVKDLIAACDAVLLPGSNADIEPAKFQQERSPHCAPPDALREQVDELLLADAYRQRKPLLGICYGLQSLNVFRGGSLIQHIPEFLPEAARMKVNHEAGKKVRVAHTVQIEQSSQLAMILQNKNRNGRARPDETPSIREGHGLSGADTASRLNQASATGGNALILPVNSSHHQSADTIGEGLRVIARCPDDNIIEAVEDTSPDHFVLAVQWHPERSVNDDAASRAIFNALVRAAR
jgi:putative glutamine amidotransferase